MRRNNLLILAAAIAVGPGVAMATPKKVRPEAQTTTPSAYLETIADLEQRQGLLTTYLDKAKGKVWLEIPATAWEEPLELLYVEGLLSGLGSNPVGLDRGQLGDTRVVRLRPVGGKLLIEQVNQGYRALSSNPLERRAVEHSFATSVIWAGTVAARSAAGDALVDITSFLLRDAHNVSATLERAEQGTFKLDPERSAIDFDACLAFPDNLEFEAVLTYAGSQPGPHVRSTTPTPEAITLVQHHSLIRLPDDGYTPRRFDPRAGNFAIEFADYATELDQPLVKRWIVRHRLTKTDPAAEVSTVVEPIVYFVDPGAPEAIRRALIDGASWWAAAFEAAGFRNAFRVELLPADAHPLDVRYNVIQWVHRSTRGWSYGSGVVDPRTGEMIKGHVSLGSLRVRQDRLIFEGLIGASKSGSGAPDDPVELALARIRQLAAHEVGHTLGLTHNFAASTYGRASVMDYPAPLVTLDDDGRLDVSQAYAVGVGSWDLFAIRYAYTQVDDATLERATLGELLHAARRDGLIFITDQDARPPGAAHPLGNLWDNGSEPVSELRRLAAVRRAALEAFGAHNLRRGAPMALLHETLVPVYFLHRFQVLAAAKVIAGLDYRYAINGEDGEPTSLLDPAWQREALEALLDLIEAGELDLREELLTLLAPRPFGYGGNRELTVSATSPAFDLLGAAQTLADMVVGQILQPERLARLVDQHRRHAEQPGLEEVLATVTERIFQRAESTSLRHREIDRVVQSAALDRMLELARSESTPRYVQYRVGDTLTDLRAGLDRDDAFERVLAARLDRFSDRREASTDAGQGAAPPPPGQPIGMDAWLSGKTDGCSWASEVREGEPWARD